MCDRRIFALTALIGAFAGAGLLLVIDAQSQQDLPFAIADTRLKSGAIAVPNGDAIGLHTSVGFLPAVEQHLPLVGLRFLDPLFFFRSIKVEFDVAPVAPSDDANVTCNAGDNTCAEAAPSNAVPTCEPENIAVIVEGASGVNRLMSFFPFDGGSKILAYAGKLLPSLAECRFRPETDGLTVCIPYDVPAGTDDPDISPTCKFNRQVEASTSVFAAERTLVCDAACHCELTLPTMPEQPRFRVVNGSAETYLRRSAVSCYGSLPFTLTAVKATPWSSSWRPFYKIGVFFLGLLVLRYVEAICENRLFKVALSFVLGVVVLSFLLVLFVYNMLQKGLHVIPGLAFLKNLDRMGVHGGAALGVAGLGGTFYSVAARLGFDPYNTWDGMEYTVKVPLFGWTDTGIPAKYVLLLSLGCIGVMFKAYYGWFEKRKVEDGVRSAVDDDGSGDMSGRYMVQMREEDGTTLWLLKWSVWALSVYAILWSWSDLLVLGCYVVAARVAYKLHLDAEHASHIPSRRAMADMHGGFQGSDTLRIEGDGAMQGDFTPAHELTSTDATGATARWTHSEEAEEFMSEQMQDMRDLYQRRPELLSRLPTRSQEAVARFLAGESHTATIPPPPARKGCCARCCGTSLGAKCRTGFLWFAALVVVFGLAGLLL